ncbi:MAG: hypothetical protein JO362_21160 [Streptomycetaceae bacterium]|nr:hypothetical protein [Streptomycetaceae bacterium]
MRTSTTLKVAGGVLGLGTLLFIIPAQAGAASGAGSNGYGPIACITGCKDSDAINSYMSQGYAYGVADAPAPNARLFHVKLRGHRHSLEFKSFSEQGKVVNDTVEQIANSENAWFDPNVVSKVEITLSDHPTVTDRDDGYHCYYENKHGDLERAGGTCNSK